MSVHRSFEAMFHQERKASAMIDMSVTQDDRIDATRIKRKRICVACLTLDSTLDHPAVEQDRVTAEVKNVTRTRDLAGGTKKLDVHVGIDLRS